MNGNIETMYYSKSVLKKGLILFAGIYQMHAVLNLLIIHEKEKIDIILLLVKQNPLIYMSIPKGTGSTCGMPPEIDFIVFETVSMSI